MRGPGERWLIYALGGGLGHIGRAVALARAARRPGRAFRILTNSPFARGLPIEEELGGAASVVRIDPALDRDGVARVVRREVEPGGFDVLIVDTFPRGLGGELATLLDAARAPKVLVHRDLDPSYVERADLRTFAARYDRILLPGEDAPLGDLPRAARTAPWLLREPVELLDRSAARRALGVDEDGRRVVVVLGCGRPEEVRSSHALAARLRATLDGRAAVRFASVIGGGGRPGAGTPTVRIWPLLGAMRGIDVIVGSGGYHSVHESRATRTPLVALARRRRYDRQDRRLAPAERIGGEDEAIGRLRDLLGRAGTGPRGEIPDFANGTREAVRLIEAT